MKIIAIGRNYAAHIEELQNEKPTDPVVFLKPDTALLKNNAPFYHPEFSEDIHHEVELVLKIKKKANTLIRTLPTPITMRSVSVLISPPGICSENARKKDYPGK